MCYRRAAVKRTPLIVVQFRTCCEWFVRFWRKEVSEDYYRRRSQPDAPFELSHLIRDWLHGARLMAMECTKPRGFSSGLVDELDRIYKETDEQLRRECEVACEWLRIAGEVQHGIRT
jgi:hypothetical protein